MKTCSYCGESKPRQEFPKDSSANDGLRSDCKNCHLRHYRSNPKYLEVNKQWHKNNPDKHRKINKRWYDKAGKEYGREYRRANRDRINFLSCIRYRKNKLNEAA